MIKGIYCLNIVVAGEMTVGFGALGPRKLPPGRYVYIGSALNNLEKRVARHRRKDKILRWHIDYLLARPEADIVAVWYLPTRQRRECTIVQRVAACGEPIIGVGSSDCHCPGHLIRVRESEPLDFAAMQMQRL